MKFIIASLLFASCCLAQENRACKPGHLYGLLAPECAPLLKELLAAPKSSEAKVVDALMLELREQMELRDAHVKKQAIETLRRAFKDRAERGSAASWPDIQAILDRYDELLSQEIMRSGKR